MKYIVLMIMLAMFVFGGVVLVNDAYSHRGGLDQYGGHHNRKMGGYHCHRPYCIHPSRRRTRQGDARGYECTIANGRVAWTKVGQRGSRRVVHPYVCDGVPVSNSN